MIKIIELQSRYYNDLLSMYKDHGKSLDRLYETGYQNGVEDTISKLLFTILTIVFLKKIYDYSIKNKKLIKTYFDKLRGHF